MIWVLIPLASAFVIVQIALSFAPRSFWRGLDEHSGAAAHFLWGFSHIFGPLSSPGLPGWEVDNRGSKDGN